MVNFYSIPLSTEWTDIGIEEKVKSKTHQSASFCLLSLTSRVHDSLVPYCLMNGLVLE